MPPHAPHPDDTVAAITALTSYIKFAGRSMALLGGLIAFVYGAFVALGFNSTTAGDRITRNEINIKQMRIEIEALKNTDTLLVHGFDDLRNIGCMTLSSRERALSNACLGRARSPERP